MYALKKANVNPRIVTWTLRLQNYEFKVVHRESRRMVHVDALSRVAVSYVELMPIEKELELKQFAS